MIEETKRPEKSHLRSSPLAPGRTSKGGASGLGVKQPILPKVTSCISSHSLHWDMQFKQLDYLDTTSKIREKVSKRASPLAPHSNTSPGASGLGPNQAD
jgi:hypothetical protein